MTRAAELGALLAPKPVTEAPLTRGGRRGGGAAAPACGRGGCRPANQRRTVPRPNLPRRTARATRVPAAERRRALGLLIGLWRDLARDLAVVGTAGAGSSVREVRALEELERAAAALPPGAAADALTRLLRAGRAARRERQPGAAARRAAHPLALDDPAGRVTDSSEPVRLDATVRGHVQGVGFRMWVLRTASRLGLRGLGAQ